MINLKLGSSEVIVHHFEEIEMGNNYGDLYITNEGIVFAYQKGIFVVKDVVIKTMFSEIKKYNNEYQIQYDEDMDGIVIFYKGGQEEFIFDNKDDANDFKDKLLNEINKNVGIIENNDDEIRMKDNKNMEYIFCTECGTKNKRSAKFCIECGNKIN